MASNSSFDRARRQLDAALGELADQPEPPPEPTDQASSDLPDPHAQAPLPVTALTAKGPREARAARVAPARRRAAAPLHLPGRSAGSSAPKDDLRAPVAPQAAPRPPSTAPATRPAPPPAADQGDGEPPQTAVPTSEALARLLVGAALLGLDGLATRADDWEAAAGMGRRRQLPAALAGEIGSGRFRHALIGWIFETEEQLRPRGNPVSWLRNLITHTFGAAFAVLVDLLPLPRLGPRRGRRQLAEPTDEETMRWVARGQTEEARSRRFARAALEDIVDHSIVYLARRPAVGRALGEIVRSPAMDDAVRQIVEGPAIEHAIRRVAASPALDEVVIKVAQSPALEAVIDKVARSPAFDHAVATIAQSPAIEAAVAHLVRTPAMEDAVRYLVGTPAMDEAIATLSKSPALVELVTTQTSSVAAEILEEVRERGVSADKLAEGLVRRLLRRPPRASLPLEVRGLILVEPEPKPVEDSYVD